MRAKKTAKISDAHWFELHVGESGTPPDAEVGDETDVERQACVRLGRIGFFFSSRRRHTRFDCDWSSDVCSSDLDPLADALLERRLDESGEEGMRLERLALELRVVLAADEVRVSLQLDHLDEPEDRKSVV